MLFIACDCYDHSICSGMCKYLFVYNYYVNRWHGSIYVFIYAIDYMCSDCSMHIYVDASKIWTHFILLVMFHSITMSYNIARYGFCVTYGIYGMVNCFLLQRNVITGGVFICVA